MGQRRQALPAADGRRIWAIHPRSDIQPSADSLTSVQVKNVAPQVGVSLRGVQVITSSHSPQGFLVQTVRVGCVGARGAMRMGVKRMVVSPRSGGRPKAPGVVTRRLFSLHLPLPSHETAAFPVEHSPEFWLAALAW